MKIKLLKIFALIILAFLLLGFVLPWLFSAKSTIAVAIGAAIVIVVCFFSALFLIKKWDKS